jgi:hypothetical protein
MASPSTARALRGFAGWFQLLAILGCAGALIAAYVSFTYGLLLVAGVYVVVAIAACVQGFWFATVSSALAQVLEGQSGQAK